jgi:hypothetical protein
MYLCLSEDFIAVPDYLLVGGDISSFPVGVSQNVASEIVFGLGGCGLMSGIAGEASTTYHLLVAIFIEGILIVSIFFLYKKKALLAFPFFFDFSTEDSQNVFSFSFRIRMFFLCLGVFFKSARLRLPGSLCDSFDLLFFYVCIYHSFRTSDLGFILFLATKFSCYLCFIMPGSSITLPWLANQHFLTSKSQQYNGSMEVIAACLHCVSYITFATSIFYLHPHPLISS